MCSVNVIGYLHIVTDIADNLSILIVVGGIKASFKLNSR